MGIPSVMIHFFFRLCKCAIDDRAFGIGGREDLLDAVGEGVVALRCKGIGHEVAVYHLKRISDRRRKDFFLRCIYLRFSKNMRGLRGAEPLKQVCACAHALLAQLRPQWGQSTKRVTFGPLGQKLTGRLCRLLCHWHRSKLYQLTVPFAGGRALRLQKENAQTSSPLDKKLEAAEMIPHWGIIMGKQVRLNLFPTGE